MLKFESLIKRDFQKEISTGATGVFWWVPVDEYREDFVLEFDQNRSLASIHNSVNGEFLEESLCLVNGEIKPLAKYPID